MSKNNTKLHANDCIKNLSEHAVSFVTTLAETLWNHSPKFTRHTVRRKSTTKYLENLKNRKQKLVQTIWGLIDLIYEMANAHNWPLLRVRQYHQRKQRSFTKSTLYNHISRGLSWNSKHSLKLHGNDRWTYGLWQTSNDTPDVMERNTLCTYTNACVINSTLPNERCLHTGLGRLDVGGIAYKWVSNTPNTMEEISVLLVAGRDKRLSQPATINPLWASNSLRFFFTHQRTGEPLANFLKMSGT